MKIRDLRGSPDRVALAASAVEILCKLSWRHRLKSSLSRIIVENRPQRQRRIMFKLYYLEEKNYNTSLIEELHLPYVEVILSDKEFKNKFPDLQSAPQVFKNNTYFGSSTTLDEYLEKYRYVHG